MSRFARKLGAVALFLTIILVISYTYKFFGDENISKPKNDYKNIDLTNYFDRYEGESPDEISEIQLRIHALVKASNQYYEMKEFDKAIEFTNEQLKYENDEQGVFSINFTLANLYIYQEEVDKGIDLLKSIINESKKNLHLKHQRMDAIKRLIEVYREHNRDDGLIIGIYKELIEDYGNSQYMYELAKAYRNNGDMHAELDIYDEMLRKYPDEFYSEYFRKTAKILLDDQVYKEYHQRIQEIIASDKARKRNVQSGSNQKGDPNNIFTDHLDMMEMYMKYYGIIGKENYNKDDNIKAMEILEKFKKKYPNESQKIKSMKDVLKIKNQVSEYLISI